MFAAVFAAVMASSDVTSSFTVFSLIRESDCVFVSVVNLIVSWREYEVESAGDLSGMASAIAVVAGRVLWVSCIHQPDCYG